MGRDLRADRRDHRRPRSLDFGTLGVNSHLVIACAVPGGGFTGSGRGRDLAIYSLDEVTRTRHVQITHTR